MLPQIPPHREPRERRRGDYGENDQSKLPAGQPEEHVKILTLPRAGCAAATERLAPLTQTTLWVDGTAAMIPVLRRRLLATEAPKREGICYATTPAAGRRTILGEIELLLMSGSRNARANGVAARVATSCLSDGLETDG